MPFIPLHLHSHWSLLDGVASISDIVSFAQANHLSAIALTDTNALYGAMEFISVCHKANIAPILGAELNVQGGHGMVLLAQNMRGYANLCQLITRLQALDDRETSLARGLAFSEIAPHADGLVCLSGGHHGPLDARLRQNNFAQAESLAQFFADAFGAENFCIELQIFEDRDFEKARALQSLADRLGVRIVATHDIHYLHRDDAAKYRVLTAMRRNVRLADLPALPDLSFPTENEMRQRFAEFPDALNATHDIAAQCQFEFPTGQWRFPALELPEGQTPRDALWAQTIEGVGARYGETDAALDVRLRKETDVIATLGYAAYFLVVADIVNYARTHGVPISPRGSASSSVVAYCLGIHDVDPIAHNLYFERFLSLERHDAPDIDLDLCSHRRDEVIQYVYRRYGADHVAMVCTYATLRARYALQEVGKAYGLPDARRKALAEKLPGYWHPGMRDDSEKMHAQLLAEARDVREREVLEMSRALEGTPHHLSVHPGGIVISSEPLTDVVPLQYATKGLLVTQFDLGGVEKAGLVKMDLLGISALTVIADCAEWIRQRDPHFSLDNIPAHDDETAKTLSSAHTIACFQIESPGMRMTLRELSAQNTHDALVALALYRPGPLKGGLKDAFVKRHLGQEAASYLHPALELVLQETYGVILYQEQVLRIAHEVAGFTLGEADTLRRAMSKFRSAHEMEHLKRKFVQGAQTTSGMDERIAQQVWDLMAAFASYGFPKAHAAGYAAVAYRMAYLKTHYPAEFMAARLAVYGGFYRQSVYISEARNLGLRVMPPHVNHSQETFTLEFPVTLWMGLGQVRELTHHTLKRIVQQRPFTSLQDFLIRASPNFGEAMNLAKAGALNGLGNPKQMLAQLESERWHGRHSEQLRLLAPPENVFIQEPTAQERAAWEREVLGLLVSVHPLALVADKLAKHERISSRELASRIGQEVTLAGVRLASHRFTTNREPMLLADMEDEAGMYQVLWSGAALQKHRALLARREPILLHGRVRKDRQGLVIVSGVDVEMLL